jgi:acetyl esterase/lipase
MSTCRRGLIGARVSPLFEGGLSDAATLIVTAECDPLRDDDGERRAKGLRQAGVQSSHVATGG